MHWDQYFMTLVYFVAMRSKDDNTHVGAVIIDQNKSIISTGYNSFPRGMNDFNRERQERPEKYYWFEHAERNAIYNAGRIGIPLEGCIMYTAGMPCMDCARAIVQVGIKEVIIHKFWINNGEERIWKENAKRSLILFDETNVKLRVWDGELKQISAIKNKEILMLNFD